MSQETKEILIIIVASAVTAFAVMAGVLLLTVKLLMPLMQ